MFACTKIQEKLGQHDNIFIRSPDKPTLRMTEGEAPGSGGARGGGGGGRHSAIKQTSHFKLCPPSL